LFPYSTTRQKSSGAIGSTFMSRTRHVIPFAPSCGGGWISKMSGHTGPLKANLRETGFLP
jgi:hypothetical protein